VILKMKDITLCVGVVLVAIHGPSWGMEAAGFSGMELKVGSG
jgi:hypothetical protein